MVSKWAPRGNMVHHSGGNENVDKTRLVSSPAVRLNIELCSLLMFSC